jgi:hypothetical protein
MKKIQSTYAGLAQENGFGSAQLHVLLPWLVKGASAAALCTSRKECVINMI